MKFGSLVVLAVLAVNAEGGALRGGYRNLGAADPNTAIPSEVPTSAPGIVSAVPTLISTASPSISPSPVTAPGVVAVSGSFCTPTDPCPICYGDCDVSGTFTVTLS